MSKHQKDSTRYDNNAQLDPERYYCKRCNKAIKILAFRGPNEYCSVHCEKMERDPSYMSEAKQRMARSKDQY